MYNLEDTDCFRLVSSFLKEFKVRCIYYGIAEGLTLIFLVLKLTGVVTWTWWTVLSPAIIALFFYSLLFIIKGVIVLIAVIAVKKRK